MYCWEKMSFLLLTDINKDIGGLASSHVLSQNSTYIKVAFLVILVVDLIAYPSFGQLKVP